MDALRNEIKFGIAERCSVDERIDRLDTARSITGGGTGDVTTFREITSVKNPPSPVSIDEDDSTLRDEFVKVNGEFRRIVGVGD
jgi:hypothetical protein